MPVTDPLRAEHAELRPHLDALDAVAASLAAWQPDTPSRLHEVVEFLVEHLLPHAAAEEAVLYPAIERTLDAAGATATMVADHRDITRRIHALDGAVLATGNAGMPTPQQIESLRAQLYGLAAILELHFAKEEDVLLPVLDAHLDADQAADLFAAMGHAAHRSEEIGHDHHH
jgi:iron-sulfur cluster repair protein YtfE (RIC family)